LPFPRTVIMMLCNFCDWDPWASWWSSGKSSYA
jgi:hypothetical protein